MTDFAVRHIGPTPAEQRQMLSSLGYSSLDELTSAALPDGTPPADLHLPGPLTETGALAELRQMAGRNQLLTSMIGQHPRNLSGTRTGRDRHLWSGGPACPGAVTDGEPATALVPGRLSMTDFAVRHIGPTPAEQQHMLDSLGYSSLDELTSAALPDGTPPADLHLPDPLTETGALAELRRMAGRNQLLTSMIGLGYYDTITPAVIRRNVLENPAWYTAYTPYQPEISQGRLEALLNFQTMVADLTGLPWAGASLLDEATAAAEAMTLARRATRKGHVFLADADCLPQTLAVLRTRAEPLGIHLVVEPVTQEAIARQGGDLFGVLLQFPGASGVIRDPAPLIEAAHAAGTLVAVAADLLALTLLRPPGEAGADIAVGSTQRFGVPLWFGGPHAGYIAVSDALKRQLPGRLVGVSVDADGRPAYRLALQAREQHIRREMATSNICTAQVLLAVTAAMYAAYHVHRGQRRAEAAAARPAGRGVGGRRRPPRLPARPAGARAAHPPGNGDEQYLHGAGPAGGDRGHVRRVPRPGRAGGHRTGRAP